MLGGGGSASLGALGVVDMAPVPVWEGGALAADGDCGQKDWQPADKTPVSRMADKVWKPFRDDIEPPSKNFLKKR